jgi:hypothetical protein
MSEELMLSKKDDLAVAIAQGVAVETWALRNQVPRSTAFHWARTQELRGLVHQLRRAALDQVVGQMVKNTTWAARSILEFAERAQSESVRLSAIKFILSKQMAAANYAILEQRVAEVEQKVDARDAEVTVVCSGTPSVSS